MFKKTADFHPVGPRKSPECQTLHRRIGGLAKGDAQVLRKRREGGKTRGVNSSTASAGSFSARKGGKKNQPERARSSGDAESGVGIELSVRKKKRPPSNTCRERFTRGDSLKDSEKKGPSMGPRKSVITNNTEERRYGVRKRLKGAVVSFYRNRGREANKCGHKRLKKKRERLVKGGSNIAAS